jgi:hypothetical protein
MHGKESVDDAIGALLHTTPGVRPPSPSEVELVLTDGYAQVLRLEAERRKLIDEMQSAEAIEGLTLRLQALRDRLDEAKRRFGSSGQLHLDRRPIAGDGVDDQRPT